VEHLVYTEGVRSSSLLPPKSLKYSDPGNSSTNSGTQN
jgi:hypothetical protein